MKLTRDTMRDMVILRRNSWRYLVSATMGGIAGYLTIGVAWWLGLAIFVAYSIGLANGIALRSGFYD